jgi:hypothetical protein
MAVNPFVDERKRNKWLLREMLTRLDNIEEKRVLALF